MSGHSIDNARESKSSPASTANRNQRELNSEQDKDPSQWNLESPPGRYSASSKGNDQDDVAESVTNSRKGWAQFRLPWRRSAPGKTEQGQSPSPELQQRRLEKHWQRKKSRLNVKVQELEQENSRFKKEVEELERGKLHLEKQAEDWKREMLWLEEKVEKLERENSHFKKEVEQGKLCSEKQVEDRNWERSQLEEKVEELERGKLCFKKEVEELEREKMHCKKEVEELERGKLRFEKQVEDWKRERLWLEGKMEELERGKLCSEKQIEDRKWERSQLKEKVEELERGKMRFKKEAEELERGKMRFKKEVEELERGKLHFKKEVEELERGKMRFRKEVEELERGKVHFGKQVEDQKRERSQLEEKVEELERENLHFKKEVEELERGKLRFEEQVEAMFKIILKLKRRGLPQHPDDHYFKTELDGLITEIRQWAIAFTWGQQPLTVESWDRIHAGMQEQTKQHLQSSFGENLDLLLVSPKAGSRLRTRCVEVILFRTLLKSFLSEPYIGFEAEDHSAYQRLLHVISSNGKNENVRLWSALTAHLLSKNTQDLQARQEERIDFITDTMLCNEMAALGDFGRGKKEALRVLVGKAAKLGLDMAQLPFYIRADDNLKPGAPFNEFEMVNVELEEEEEFQSMMTSIIVTPAWLKITFDDEGRERFNPYDPACYVTKARVSCFHCPRVRRST